MITYCISLLNRPERYRDVQSEFPKLGLNVTKFPAIRDIVGHRGCIRSHQACLTYAISRHNTPFMVIEDDIKMIGLKSSLDKAMRQLPEDWDCLYLGATLTQQLDRYSPNLYVLKGGLTTHAIIYNSKRVVDYIIKNAYDPHIPPNLQFVDTFMVNVQEKFNCFITYPIILTQAPGYSDTCNKHCDYDVIKNSYNLYTDGRLRYN